MNFQVYSKKANLLTKLRFTLKTVKYYFEVLWHLKVKKLWFLNICSKIFRNGYERVLFFVHDIRKKMTTEKEWESIFLIVVEGLMATWGFKQTSILRSHLLRLTVIPWKSEVRRAVGSSSLSRSLLWMNSEVPREVERPSAWATIATERTIYLERVRVLGYFPLDQKFRTFITGPGKLARKSPWKVSGKSIKCLISKLRTIRQK